MIHFYTWATPNERKVSILLEELGLDYEVQVVKTLCCDSVSPEAFVEGWFSTTHKDAFDELSPYLETLLERKPKGLDAVLDAPFFN